MKNSAQGVKETAFGLLPVDWDCLPLGKLVNNVSYGSSAKSSSSGLVPVLRMGNLQGGFIDWGDLVYTSDKGEIDKYTLEKNDVLFNRTNTVDLVGKTAIYKGERPAIYAGYLIKIDNKKELLNSDYLNYVLNTHQTKSYNRLILSVAVSQANINGQKLRTYPIPLPPTLGEQVAIANALQDVDSLLVELEKLITKKQAIKTASMQQLLTGKKRLPEFSLHTEGTKKGQPKGMKLSDIGDMPEDWGYVTIRDMVRNIIDYRGRTPKKLGLAWGGGDIVALSAGNVKPGFIDLDEECYFGSNRLYSRWMKNGDVEKDDIVFTMEAPLGNAALIPDSKKYILSQRTILLQLKRERFEPSFIFQVLMSSAFQTLLSDSATGSTAQGIKRARFEQLSMLLPSEKDEQVAIAKVLSDMDEEIQKLKQRLEKTRRIKKGMMQELLTGKTRLPFKKD